MKPIYRSLIVRNSLLAAVMLQQTACYKDKEYNASNLIPKTLFLFSASVDSVPADGATEVMLTASGFPINTEDSGNSVAFTTDYGTFLSTGANSATVPWTYVYLPNDSLERIATIFLHGTIIPDTAHLMAAVNGVTAPKSLYFYRAYPDLMYILPSSLFVRTSDSAGIAITVDLVRHSGAVSLYTPVSLVVRNNSGASVGAFSIYQNLCDSSGRCLFQYVFQDTSYTGTLSVIAQVGNNPPVLSDTLTMTVVP